jgi:2,3-bisphosphoglycerate-independent phosphoglycerate mutase
MRYVVVRCEDIARGTDQTAALLEGARLLHLQHLAQAGAAGVIHPRRGRSGKLDRFHLHRTLLGVEPNDPEPTAGRCYAASAQCELGPGETAWCCDFMTQRDGRVVDPTAGNITTKEGRVLLQALTDQFASETRRWVPGDGSHHVLITRDPQLHTDERHPVQTPGALFGEPWKQVLPKGTRGEALSSLIEQAVAVLEQHPVNRVRVDLGENPANMLWFWGASEAGAIRTFTERTKQSGRVVTKNFALRGLARVLELPWTDGPSNFEEPSLQRLLKTLRPAIQETDFTYVQLRIDSSDPIERLCDMERIDRFLLQPLTEWLPELGPWRLLVALDDRASGTVPFVAIGTGLPQQPVSRLGPQELAESPLRFEEGEGLFAWLTKE